MPAETHSHHEPATVDDIVDLLGNLLDLGGDVASTRLADLGLDDDLGVFSLWEAVAAELAERTVGELDIDDARVETLGELALVFATVLQQPDAD